MTAYVSPNHETVDIGIMIGSRKVWGAGMGQYPWNTLLDWFDTHYKIRKITASAMSCNKPMIKLMERSGMSLEASFENQEILDGAPYDMVHFSKFNPSYNK
tara:strand:- start:9419 stop:9721 length:303 start_codon:yes stop_codon:yes gene_type:complete